MEGVGDHLSSLKTANVDTETENSERIRDIALQESKALEAEDASTAVVSAGEHSNQFGNTVKTWADTTLMAVKNMLLNLYLVGATRRKKRKDVRRRKKGLLVAVLRTQSVWLG